VTLSYHQIPEDRRTLGDFTGRIGEHNGVLGAALAQWTARDDTRGEPDVRRAASAAVGAIDAMLAELHALRARLLTEIRASDDAAAIRADKLLAGSADAATTAGGQASQGPRLRGNRRPERRERPGRSERQYR
jgi:hypothetical protein